MKHAVTPIGAGAAYREGGQPCSPLTPPLSADAISFTTPKIRVKGGNKVECSARCTGISGIFNEIPIKLCITGRDGRAATVEGRLTSLPDIDQKQTSALLDRQFWVEPLLFSNPAGQTRRQFFENQLKAAAAAASQLTTETRLSLGDDLNRLLKNKIELIAQRLALEIKLQNDPLAKKILATEK